jgi:hypothetical protein
MFIEEGHQLLLASLQICATADKCEFHLKFLRNSKASICCVAEKRNEDRFATKIEFLTPEC